MTVTSPFFNNYRNHQEQLLLEDLITEAIKLKGFECYYIPNDNTIANDLLYGDSPLKKFESAYIIPALLVNAIDPGMNNEFFSKFGLEIKNNVRIAIPRRDFAKNVPQHTHSRPKEGDLIYIHFLSGNGELYEIKYVNDTVDNFMLGRERPYSWELELELFKYSHEEMDTGIEEIDIIEDNSSYAIDFHLTSNGRYLRNEIVFQSVNDVSNATATAEVSSYNSNTDILKLIHINGNFSNTLPIKGLTSLSYCYYDNSDPLVTEERMDSFDNKTIEDEVISIINTDEVNPLGSLGHNFNRDF